MTLRAKTLLIIGLATVCLILFPYILLNRILRDRIDEIEKETAARGIDNAVILLEDELKGVEAIADDWSARTETYEFVEGKRPDFPGVNFLPSTFQELRASVFMFTRTNGDFLYARAYDLGGGRAMPVPAGLASMPSENAELRERMTTPEGASGMMLVEGQPMLVAIKPVTRSDGSGPIIASLLVGRYWHATQTKRLSAKLGDIISVYSLEDPRTPAQLVPKEGSPILLQTRLLHSVKESVVSGYALLPDLAGDQPMVLQVDTIRSAFGQSSLNIYYFVLSMLPAVLLFGILITFTLEHLILARLSRLTSRVAKIRTSGNFDVNVVLTGRDELTALSREFSKMISALQESHQALRESEERYRTLIQHQGEGIGSVDENEVFTFCNPVAEEVFGVAPGTLVGKGLNEFTEAAEWERVRLETARRRLGGRTTYQLEIIRPGGQRRQILLTATPWFKEDGSYGGALAIFRDETIRIRAEIQLRQVEAMRRQFFDGASHELKTPLTATLGMVETMLRGAANPELQTKYLQRIREQTVRMSKLIEDLLTLSRLEAAEDVLHIEAVDLCEPVLEAVDALADAAEAKGIKITAPMPDEHLYVTADRDGLLMMVNNLLDNAIKYTPAGGEVSIACRKEEDFVVLEVTDTGIGIELSEQDHIFDRFYRVDRARSRDMGGTGLGLSIVSELARLQGGSIAVSSEPGMGSVFTLSIPAADDPGQQ